MWCTMSASVERIGSVLGGKYRPLRRLAVGGMGAVYEAEHVEIGHHVAVKVMKRELADRAEAVARFRREAQIAGNLGHDNICAVLDVGATPDGAPYLVMPLLKGRSLAQVLAESGPMPEERALDVAAQVLSALAAAHQVGVVHRDLKPDNVFLTQVGERDDFVKVLDFGISKVLGAQREASALTQTGTLVGTPYYMAPEQARGLKDQDVRVDVYAVGVMLYEMLTGHLPFAGDQIGDVIIKIATEGFARPRQLRPDLAPAVEAFVLRAMERDRERRFSDASSMRDEALRLLTGTAAPVTATPVPSRTTPATPSPIPVPVAPRTATDLGQTTPFGWSSQSLERPPRSSRAWLVVTAVVLALAGGALALVAAYEPAGSTATPAAAPPRPAEAPSPAPAAPVTEPALAPVPTPASPSVGATSRVVPPSARAPEGVAPPPAEPPRPAAGKRPAKRPAAAQGAGIEGPAGTTFTTENE